MIWLYYAAVGVALLVFLFYLLSNFRRALLVGVVFTTLTLAGLPWNLLPVDGAAFGVQIGFLLLVFTWFLVRKNNGASVRIAFNRYLIGLFVLEFVLIAYLLISEDTGYGASVVAWLLVKSILPLLALGFLAPFDEVDIRLIAGAIVTGAVLTALRLLSGGNTGTITRLSVGADSSPITVGRVIGLGAALLTLQVLLSPRFRSGRTLARLALLGFLLYAVALTGSRGPLVASVLVVPAGFVFLGSSGGKRSRIIIALAVAFFFLAGLALLLPPQVFEPWGIQRIVNGFDTLGSNLSDRTRLALFDIAWQGFLASSGLGLGTGGFAALNDTSTYPHNLFLEVAVGQGVLGLAILCLLFLATVRRMATLSNLAQLSADTRALMGLWFFGLINAMVSMDIPGNYMLWVSGGLIWILARSAREATRSRMQIALRGSQT